jgi:hypothetical protein
MVDPKIAASVQPLPGLKVRIRLLLRAPRAASGRSAKHRDELSLPRDELSLPRDEHEQIPTARYFLGRQNYHIP